MQAGRRRRIQWLLAAACALRVAAEPCDAQGDDGPENVPESERFPIADVQLESGLVMEDFFFQSGFGRIASAGGGLRTSLTVAPNGFVRGLEDRLYFTPGLWLTRDVGCALGSAAEADAAPAFGLGGSSGTVNRTGCGATHALLPLSLEWSVAVAPRWTLFLEPGVVIWARVTPEVCGATDQCHAQGVFPSFGLGSRWVLGKHVAAMGRVGFPFLSLGLAFM